MFNGIWLVASEPLTVRGREYQTGERFELSRTKSGALLVTGRASVAPRVPPAPVPAPPATRRRGRPRKTEEEAAVHESSDVPETSSVDDTDSDVQPPRRRYRRRDLEAEV